jgi:hypothetical protein
VHRFVVIPTWHCTNLAAAVYTVLYDRHAKRVTAGLEDAHTVAGRGFDEPDHMADSVGVRRGEMKHLGSDARYSSRRWGRTRNRCANWASRDAAEAVGNRRPAVEPRGRSGGQGGRFGAQRLAAPGVPVTVVRCESLNTLSMRAAVPISATMKLLVRAAVAAVAAVLPLTTAGAAQASEPDTVAVTDTFVAAGEHTLVVLPVFWTAPDAQTRTSLHALARQVGDYWSEQTSGTLTVPDASITVHDWMRIADPVTCDKEAIFYAALSAANVRAGSYHKHVIVYFPQATYCPWQGTATVGDEGNIFDGTYGWIWINGYTSGDVWEREFGHNLSLGHANTAKCHSSDGTQVPLSNTCDMRDYQDYDLMGNARGHDGFTLNTALADRIGMLDPDAVRTASVGASFTLSPVSSHTGLLAVKIPLSSSILYVEYRPRTGRDAAEPPGWSGVQVRQRNTWDYFSRVLALNPDGSDGLLANAAAQVGVAWRIPGTYMSLVVDSEDGTGARIRFAPLPDSTPPPAPQAPTVGGTATVSGIAQRDGIIGGGLYLNWPPLDDPESGIASFQVYVDDAVVGTVSGTTFASSLPVLPDGAHRVRVDATNNAGMTTAGAEISFHCEPAPTTPHAPTVTAATHGSQLSGELALDWPAVSDADLTGYQIYVDETPVGTVGADTTLYRVNALATGYHSARVVAVNAIGLGMTSTPTAFTVDASAPPAPAAPTVTAAAQYNGNLRGTLQITWPAVHDPDSDIASYRVFVGDTLVATATTAGNPVQVGAQPTGTYQVRVDAVNGAGLTTTGATTTIRVDNSAPVLSVPTQHPTATRHYQRHPKAKAKAKAKPKPKPKPKPHHGARR